MKFITLTKDNSSSVEIRCGKPQNYYKYEMKFFKKPMIYVFQEPVEVQKCTYSMLMTEISLNDQSTLNGLFSRIDKLIEITDRSFISLKKEISYENSSKSMITAEILGYKRLENNLTPIWKVKSIEKIA